MVKGGDPCYEGNGFKSQHWTLDRHFFTFISCKNCNVCLKGLKGHKLKGGRGWPIKNLFYFVLLNIIVFLCGCKTLFCTEHIVYYNVCNTDWQSSCVLPTSEACSSKLIIIAPIGAHASIFLFLAIYLSELII